MVYKPHNCPIWAEFTVAEAVVLLLHGLFYSNKLLLLWPHLNWIPTNSGWKMMPWLRLTRLSWPGKMAGCSLSKPPVAPQRRAPSETPLRDSAEPSLQLWCCVGRAATQLLIQVHPKHSCWLPVWLPLGADAILAAWMEQWGLARYCDGVEPSMDLVFFNFMSLVSVGVEEHLSSRHWKWISKQHRSPHWNVWKWGMDNLGKFWYTRRDSRLFYVELLLSKPCR